jgi:hypothetical protein
MRGGHRLHNKSVNIGGKISLGRKKYQPMSFGGKRYEKMEEKKEENVKEIGETTQEKGEIKVYREK